jgi:hypothetical protein
MKTKNLVFIIILSFIYFTSCTMNKPKDNGSGTTEEKYFNTPDDAVKQAQSDMLEILKNHKDINLGVTYDQLQAATPASSVIQSEIDFGLILQNKDVTQMSDIVKGEKNIIAPFSDKRSIVAVAEVAKVEKGWKITALGNAVITSNLNMLNKVLQGIEGKNIAIFEVPNLNILIYQVKENEKNVYYLNNNMERPREFIDVYAELLNEATIFQKEFGEQLQKDKLVK